ncbi:unnamed protein product [Macrosiphum euphorbiae]|nr:unnamed protein product [Macrosiphum euphorbiae]
MKIGQLIVDAEFKELDELEKINTTITYKESTRTNVSNCSNYMTQNEAINTGPGYNTSHCEQLYPSCSIRRVLVDNYVRDVSADDGDGGSRKRDVAT